jgi:hypothetical protein
MPTSSYHDPSSLVSRPLDELAVTVSGPVGFASGWGSLAADDGSISVGSLVSGEVLLTTGTERLETQMEFHLSPAQALTVAHRLIRMAAYLVAHSPGEERDPLPSST